MIIDIEEIVEEIRTGAECKANTAKEGDYDRVFTFREVVQYIQICNKHGRYSEYILQSVNGEDTEYVYNIRLICGKQCELYLMDGSIDLPGSDWWLRVDYDTEFDNIIIYRVGDNDFYEDTYEHRRIYRPLRSLTLGGFKYPKPHQLLRELGDLDAKGNHELNHLYRPLKECQFVLTLIST